MSKHILIIGGNSGIGLKLAELLQQEGCQVTTASRQDGDLDVKEDSPKFPEINLPIDGIVYCPGSILLKPFRGLKIENFQEDLLVNYLGAVKTIQHYLKQLNENSSIVFFSSVAVSKGMAYHASIAGAKGAVEGLTRSLAAELSPKTRVNCIAPSLTETPLSEKLLRNEKLRENAAQRHPLKQIGEANDIAQMAQFLLSDKSKWITGQILHVDGGMSTVSNV
ncbi:MAG: SDR family NAD(P)-dependent oxidoreductase [Bacteroidia bacterium]